MKTIGAKHIFEYEGNTFNVFHANKGEGLEKHEHDYNHATICHNGSAVIRKENVEQIIHKGMSAFDLKANEWHEIEALEDNTVFVNIYLTKNIRKSN
jgi:quercetin dioxygenase-like cupin family protein